MVKVIEDSSPRATRSIGTFATSPGSVATETILMTRVGVGVGDGVGVGVGLGVGVGDGIPIGTSGSDRPSIRCVSGSAWPIGPMIVAAPVVRLMVTSVATPDKFNAAYASPVPC